MALRGGGGGVRRPGGHHGGSVASPGRSPRSVGDGGHVSFPSVPSAGTASVGRGGGGPVRAMSMPASPTGGGSFRMGSSASNPAGVGPSIPPSPLGIARTGSGMSLSRGGTPTTVVGPSPDRVKVAVRVRPLMPHELERADKTAVASSADGTYLQCITTGAGDREMRKNYNFDMCLGPEAQQSTVFEATGVKDLVDSALDGYAATVFAYGQTGSGKTYTMAGMEERLASDEWVERAHHGGESIDGIIPRAARYLFEDVARARSSNPGMSVVVRASYCEIYNEQVYDLLNLKSSTLPVRWNEKNGFFVQGLLVCTCENVDDVMAVVNEGHRNRTVGSHKLNLDSSRSHCILTLRVETALLDPEDGHRVVKYGKVVFVDLAGSERLKESNSEGIAKKETGQINKSLFTLGKVISALGDAKRRSSHVPYRDSKLTKLLMDSLGGSCLTVMIACVSPSQVYLEETLNTLNYATRANNIKNKPSVHVDPQEQLIFNLRQEVKFLRMENDWLRAQMGGQTLVSPFPLPRTWSGSARGPPPGAMAAGSLVPHNDATGSPRSHSVSESHPRRVPPLGGGAGPMRPSSGSPRQIQRPGSEPPDSHRPMRGRSYSTSSQQLVDSTSMSGPGGRDSKGPSMTSTDSERRKLEHYDQMVGIVSKYQAELTRLRKEHGLAQARATISERDYGTVMSENEFLASRLEHLEEVFVTGGGVRPKVGGGADGAGGDEDSAWGRSGSRAGDVEAAAEEADRLRRALHKVLADNEVLRRKVNQIDVDVGIDSRSDDGKLDEDDADASPATLHRTNAGLRKQLSRLKQREVELMEMLAEARADRGGRADLPRLDSSDEEDGHRAAAGSATPTLAAAPAPGSRRHK